MISNSLFEQAPFADALRLWLLYKTWLGKVLLSLPITWWLLSWQHHRVGRFANSPESKRSVQSFIEVSRLIMASNGQTM